MFSQVEDLLPVISFGKKADNETEKKHDEFVNRMVSRGYTPRQVRRLVEWYMRVKKGGLRDAALVAKSHRERFLRVGFTSVLLRDIRSDWGLRATASV